MINGTCIDSLYRKTFLNRDCCVLVYGKFSYISNKTDFCVQENIQERNKTLMRLKIPQSMLKNKIGKSLSFFLFLDDDNLKITIQSAFQLVVQEDLTMPQ